MGTGKTREDVVKLLVKASNKTCDLYSYLEGKAKQQSVKNIFIKLRGDEAQFCEKYEKMPGGLDYKDRDNIKELDIDEIYKGITIRWWCTREEALTISDSILRRFISYLQRLKAAFPNTADDILDDAIFFEQKQLKYIVDAHNLQISNSIMI